jgi:hypothetical protein
MNRTIIIIGLLLVLIGGLFFERLIASEYITFLERDVRIEQAHRNLKEGMNEWEVMNLTIGLPPDGVYELDGEDNAIRRVWAVKEHIGLFHRLLGIEARDEKSYMELHLDFDKEKRLIRIYYGG